MKNSHKWVLGWLWSSGGATWLCSCGAVKEQSFDIPNQGFDDCQENKKVKK